LFNAIPLVAIGGINEHNAAAVLATGIKHLAVAQAFAKAEQPEQWVSLMRALWHPANKEDQHAE
jgi:hydroxymethylpyrimidine kinase/phosphomethylpyrimidine kinase/thiamine-phosphate diphosphorylase